MRHRRIGIDVGGSRVKGAVVDLSRGVVEAELTSKFLAIVEDVVWPDLIVVGGGISEDWPHWLPLLSTRARCVVAKTRNAAGIIGAAMAAGAVTRTEELRPG